MERVLYRSPYGLMELYIVDGRAKKLRLLSRPAKAASRRRSGAGERFIAALDRYFSGAEPGVGLGEMDLSGCTDFQRRVYAELLKVPFGGTVTYGALAERLGLRGGARAVGGALARNPLPVFIPCHRVLPAGGGLGGFGAGLRWKAALLRHEGVHP